MAIKIIAHRKNEELTGNRKLEWISENILKIQSLSDVLHEKLHELIAKMDLAEKQIEVFGKYEIKGKICCHVSQKNVEYYYDVTEISCSNNQPIDEFYRKLEKNFAASQSQLGNQLSLPMFCLIDHDILSLEEIVNLQPDNFYIMVNIEL